MEIFKPWEEKKRGIEYDAMQRNEGKRGKK